MTEPQPPTCPTCGQPTPETAPDDQHFLAIYRQLDPVCQGVVRHVADKFYERTVVAAHAQQTTPRTARDRARRP